MSGVKWQCQADAHPDDAVAVMQGHVNRNQYAVGAISYGLGAEAVMPPPTGPIRFSFIRLAISRQRLCLALELQHHVVVRCQPHACAQNVLQHRALLGQRIDDRCALGHQGGLGQVGQQHCHRVQAVESRLTILQRATVEQCPSDVLIFYSYSTQGVNDICSWLTHTRPIHPRTPRTVHGTVQPQLSVYQPAGLLPS